MPEKMVGPILVEVVSYGQFYKPEQQNDGTTECWKRLVPQILKDGMTTAEWWKITPNLNKKIESHHFHILGGSIKGMGQHASVMFINY